MAVHLVRHGRSAPERGRPAADWGLDERADQGIRALRDAGVLPCSARWFSSPEPKALATAQQLAAPGDQVGVVVDLREHERSVRWFDDQLAFERAVEAALRNA